jgi:hypothetical protein
MLSDINLQVSMGSVIWPSVINGIAISFIFVPLTTATMSQLGQAQIGNASGLYNLMRNLGGSIGIAFVTTMLARGAQAHQALMVGHLTPTDPAFAQRFAAAKQVLSHQTDPVTATRQAYDAVYSLLDQQAHLWAFVDNFYLFGLLRIGRRPADFPVQTRSIHQTACGRRRCRALISKPQFSRAWVDSFGKSRKIGVALPMLAMKTEMKTQRTMGCGRGFTWIELLPVNRLVIH